MTSTVQMMSWFQISPSVSHLQPDSCIMFQLLPYLMTKPMLDGIQTSKMVSRLNSENLEYLPKVWFIKIWTTYNLSLWLCEYLWIILLYGHLVYFIQRSWHEKSAIWNEDLPKKSWQRHKDSLCTVRIFMNQTLPQFQYP